MAENAMGDIYNSAVFLHYMLAPGVLKNKMTGTAEEAMQALVTLVESNHAAALLAADFIEMRIRDDGVHYDDVLIIMRSILCRARKRAAVGNGRD